MKLSFQNIHFSHGVLRGSLALPLDGITLLKGENGVGKTSFLEYLKTHQKDFFTTPVFFLSQFELDSSPHLRGQDLVKIIRRNLESKLDLGQINDFILPENFLEKRVSHLSGGEKQLLKLFLTFHFKAHYWILDEPFNHLDRARKQMVEDFIWNKLRNVLLIDHSFQRGKRKVDKEVFLKKEGEVLFFEEESYGD